MRVEFHCNICLEDFREEDIRVYNNCGHSICVGCADKWKGRGTCVVCRNRSQAIRPFLDIRLKPSVRPRNADDEAPKEDLLKQLRERARKLRDDCKDAEKAEALSATGLDDLVRAMRAEGVEIQEDVLESIEQLKNTYVRQCKAFQDDARRLRRERDAARDEVTAQRRTIARHDALLASAKRERVVAAEAEIRRAKENEQVAIASAEQAAALVVQLRRELATVQAQRDQAQEEVKDYKSKITRFKAKTEASKKEALEYKNRLAHLQQLQAGPNHTPETNRSLPERPLIPEASTTRVASNLARPHEIGATTPEGIDDSLMVLDDDFDMLPIPPIDMAVERPEKSSRKLMKLRKTDNNRLFDSEWNLPGLGTAPQKRRGLNSSNGLPLNIRNGVVQGAFSTGPRKRVKYSG